MTLTDRVYFDNSPIPLWEEDFSAVADFFTELRALGVTDFRDHLDNHPEDLAQIAAMVEVIDVNKASCELFGVARKEDLSLVLDDYFTEESRHIFKEEVIALANGELRFESLMPIRHPNGAILYLEIRLLVVEGHESDLSRVVVSFVNATERLLAEANLVRSRYKLEQSNRTKNRLFSIIAHDLLNPFNVIAGFSDLLANEDDLTEEEVKEYSDILNETSRGALRLLNNLLSWSKLQLDRIEINPKSTTTKILIQESISAYHPIANKKNIRTELPAEEYPINIDSDIIRTVISNLYHNAIKFTPRDGMISFTLEETKDRILLGIQDSGLGMTPEKVAAILTNTRTSSTSGTNLEKGSGLGLLVCKDFLRMHGADLDVSSVLNEGTTFSFSMPKD